MALNKLCWREVKHDLSTLPTVSSGRTRNKTQESCSLVISLILLVAPAALFVDVLPQPHRGEVRKKCICFVQSLFVLSRELEIGASPEQCFCRGELWAWISLFAFVLGLGGGELGRRRGKCCSVFQASLGSVVEKGPFSPSLRSLVMEGWLSLLPKCIWCPEGASGFD